MHVFCKHPCKLAIKNNGDISDVIFYPTSLKTFAFIIYHITIKIQCRVFACPQLPRTMPFAVRASLGNAHSALSAQKLFQKIRYAFVFRRLRFFDAPYDVLDAH